MTTQRAREAAGMAAAGGLALAAALVVAVGVTAGAAAYAAACLGARAAVVARSVAAGLASVRPARPRPAGRRVARLRMPRPATVAAVVTWLVAGLTLFVCYLHVSRTAAVTSDGASNALQAWDMLHHNLLLRGWHLSDVSFYTTELPQYMLIEAVRGLTPDVVHVASAMTYTMLVLLAALVARGRATGRAAMARRLVAAGIMLAPQPGGAVYVLMGSPDHTGSAVPVLLAFLLLDRAPRRWYAPVGAGALLGWAMVADGIVLYTGVLPVMVVGLARAYRARFCRGQRWRGTWPDLALAVAALGGACAAEAALRLIARDGGFQAWPVTAMLASTGDLPHYLATAGHGLLMLFGADFFGQPLGAAAALAMAHLAGLALVAWAVCAAIRRFGEADLAVQLLAVAIVLVVAAYVLGARAADLLTARDITAVLPFGAALAGRVLAGRLAALRLLPAAGIVLIAYLVSLGRVVTAPPAPPASAGLAAWLAAHHLDYGLAGYWNANVTTLDTGGRVRLRSVLGDGNQVAADYWEVRADWFDPKVNDANFLVLVPRPPGFKRYMSIASVRQTFGQPARIYYVGTYAILVWDKNLLAELVPGAPLAPRGPAVAPAVTPLPAPPGE